ncbi:MAG: hypothetical protein IJI39_06825, partial [Clostridia bacterium]|nr:hypothetical protein [Clostridia bacterium]
GQQKYKELQEQMKQLQRDEELYNLQVSNNAVIENLEAEYSKLEADKASVLAGIARNTDIDVSGIVGTLTSDLDGYAGSITSLLQTLINTVANKEFVGPTTNMNDNRNLVNNFYQIPMQQIIENAGLGGH